MRKTMQRAGRAAAIRVLASKAFDALLHGVIMGAMVLMTIVQGKRAYPRAFGLLAGSALAVITLAALTCGCAGQAPQPATPPPPAEEFHMLFEVQAPAGTMGDAVFFGGDSPAPAKVRIATSLQAPNRGNCRPFLISTGQEFSTRELAIAAGREQGLIDLRVGERCFSSDDSLRSANRTMKPTAFVVGQ